MTTIASITIADDPTAWTEAGFTVDEGGSCTIGTVRLLFEPGGGEGIVSWALVDPASSVADLDGLPTSSGSPFPASTGAAHPIGSSRIDHVVVMTPDLDRTTAVIEGVLGVPLKRVRDTEAMGRPIRQGFFRFGEVILEVVGPAVPEAGALPAEPARFWGLALIVDDLDAAFALLGPKRMTAPKPAVQPGRHIARLTGLGVPVALMDA